jgi:hypothetical protein
VAVIKVSTALDSPTTHSILASQLFISYVANYIV